MHLRPPVPSKGQSVSLRGHRLQRSLCAAHSTREALDLISYISLALSWLNFPNIEQPIEKGGIWIMGVSYFVGFTCPCVWLIWGKGAFGLPS